MNWGSKILAAGIVHKVSKDKKPASGWFELIFVTFCILVSLVFGVWAILQ
jgi:hypothetical protein